jgi:hypothetical protein
MTASALVPVPIWRLLPATPLMGPEMVPVTPLAPMRAWPVRVMPPAQTLFVPVKRMPPSWPYE